MSKKIIVGAVIFFMLVLFSLSFSEEQNEEESFTITTYYPSPYGSYNELTTYSNAYLATSSGNVGIGTTNPTSKLTITGGYIQGTQESWGYQARTQGIIIMPEGTVTDDGAGKVILGGTIIVMNPLAGSYIRIAAGTYTFAPWSYMWINLPPTGTRAATVVPTISNWSDTDRPYDGRDRIIIGQRQASGKVYWKFGTTPTTPGYHYVTFYNSADCRAKCKLDVTKNGTMNNCTCLADGVTCGAPGTNCYSMSGSVTISGDKMTVQGSAIKGGDGVFTSAEDCDASCGYSCSICGCCGYWRHSGTSTTAPSCGQYYFN